MVAACNAKLPSQHWGMTHTQGTNIYTGNEPYFHDKMIKIMASIFFFFAV